MAHSLSSDAPMISVVIPARNEAGNLLRLLNEISAALDGRVFEVLVIDDGSSDDTASLLTEIARKDTRMRYHRHARSLGQSAGIQTGVRLARGPVICTLDGDGQNDPSFLPQAIDALNGADIGLVAGQRIGRKAPWSKQWGSWIANQVRRLMLGDKTRDTGCGLKVFRRHAFLDLPYFEGMHRFLPALFMGDGWRVVHIDVIDRPRMSGTSNYGNLDRLIKTLPDLFGVWWLICRRRRNPLPELRDKDRLS